MFRLSVSNIAWEQHNSPAVFSVLRKHGVAGIEVAPSKIWADWIGASGDAAKEYRKELSDLGFQVPAMQALLFGKDNLQVFEEATHPAFFEHLRLVAEIAEGLHAKVLVFGAPKNRRRGALGGQEAMEKASIFFREAGKICSEHGAVLGIEPNPAEYHCDFINNIADARELVLQTDSPGVKLHIDSGAAAVNGEELTTALYNAGDFVHYHISEPHLVNVAAGQTDHRAAFAVLKKIRYAHWVSLEMRREEPELEKLEAAVQKIKEEIHAA